MTGKHTSEKPAPVVATKAAAPPSPPVASAIPASKSKCARCSQGFFCADHAPLPGQASTPATCQSPSMHTCGMRTKHTVLTPPSSAQVRPLLGLPNPQPVWGLLPPRLRPQINLSRRMCGRSKFVRAKGVGPASAR